MVQEREDEVVCILVLVAILESEDFEHHVGQNIRHPHGDLGSAAAVKALTFDFALYEVITHQVGAADVERH